MLLGCGSRVTLTLAQLQPLPSRLRQHGAGWQHSVRAPNRRLSLSVCFLGTDDVSVATLRILVESLNGGGEAPGVVSRIHVVCPSDRPAGRGQKITSVPVKLFAQQHSLPVSEIPFGLTDLRKWQASFLLPASDVGVVVSFGYFLRANILDTLRFGAINMHPSLLPKFRGAAPVPHTILSGDATTGVSVIEIHRRRFDAGRILRQDRTAVLPEETASELTTRLAGLGARGVLHVLQDLEAATHGTGPAASSSSPFEELPLPGRLQDEALASSAPKLQPEMGLLRWAGPGASAQAVSMEQVLRRCRAFDAAFGVYSHFTFGKPVGEPKRVRLLRLARLPAGAADQQPAATECWPWTLSAVDTQPPPGSLSYSPSQKRLALRCSDGWLEVQSLQAENKKPLRGLDFANGYHIREATGHALVTLHPHAAGDLIAPGATTVTAAAAGAPKGGLPPP